MAEHEVNITPEILDSIIDEVDHETEMNFKLRSEGVLMDFDNMRWIRLLVSKMPAMFSTDDPRNEAPRLWGIALGAFKIGLLTGGGRVDLEDWFRARSIDHYRSQGGNNG